MALHNVYDITKKKREKDIYFAYYTTTLSLEEEGCVFKIMSKISALTKQFWTCTNTRTRATINTLRCLAGCSIGDYSCLIYLQSQYPTLPLTISVPAACVSGISTSLLLETILLNRGKDKLPLTKSFTMALNMSFISMLSMELAENACEIVLTGGDFSNPVAYLALIPSTIAGFVAAYPYNYYQLRKYGRSCH